jgi:hypothetical protein
MKKALQTLMAVCALTSVAQAQFTYTEWHSETPTTWTAQAIDNVSNRPVEVRFASTEPSADAIGEFASQMAEFRGAILGDAFRHTLMAESLPKGDRDDPANRIATHLPEEIEFNDFSSDGAEAIDGRPGESDQRMLFQAVLEKLETDVRDKGRAQKSDTPAIPTAEDGSVPEPAFFSLVGVMALLGIAVLRSWTGA